MGPAMRALDERQRAFVLAVLQYPTATRQKWTRIAGYGTEGSSSLYHRVQGHRLMSSRRIQAAIKEETDNRVKLGGAIGIAGLIAMASDPKHRHYLKACESLADRAGFSAVQKVDVKHEHTDLTGDAVRKEIARLAAKVGIEPQKLLGGSVIEGEFVEVKEDKDVGSL